MIRSEASIAQRTTPLLLVKLRAENWSSVPSAPGVYWWYFPRECLDLFRISELCDVSGLKLRTAADGKVCLYHGMANNLAERIAWHAAQKLTLGCLKSGFLSTFRFSLLALNDYDYRSGSEQIDAFFDTLSVDWLATKSRDAAVAMEGSEFAGPYHYPLNIQGNRRPELAAFLRRLKSDRSAYKRRHLHSILSPEAASGSKVRSKHATIILVSCVSQKRETACAARDLYVSNLFRKARRFAERSGHPWFILSAEHGLIAPDEVVAPYDRTLNTMKSTERRAWGTRVAAQLAEAAPDVTRVVFLAGQRYREHLESELASRGVEVSVPMKGLAIGRQLQWLARNSPSASA